MRSTICTIVFAILTGIVATQLSFAEDTPEKQADAIKPLVRVEGE